ncbi:UxaA family hydrolase [Desulfosporosinus lacus]|uniref:Altronate dehydratase large subunit n=1 Tax=Desulfosporosinus lacus DSM 15449 TaxID=1121420 RepID=A0A1M5ZMS5_9FIRM|nr:UxaA family hydrolase [Desulfosporosinus lacus]SHI25675.1 altronate dehydratase large subunit [Desulfosporosinus lacus DSM 15449]
MHTFYGYRRPQGLPGVRNLVAIIPSVFCANTVVRRITQQVAGTVELTHPVGCSQVGLDLELTAKALKGVGRHPNFYGVVVVGLGCERFRAKELADSIAATGKPVEMLVIQEEGDTQEAIAKGVLLAQKLVEQAAKQQKEEFPLSELCLGLKCGGTDATSGIAANPVLGWVTDQIVAEGGSAMLTEVTELIGAEHVLARRAVTPQVGQKILETIHNMENKLKVGTAHCDLQNRSALISPGNEDGGVTTVVEKALGGIHKGGTGPITGVLAYGEPLVEHGLYILDCPGHDGEAVTGLAASGCQVVVFTTGRGTPTGFPGVPVVKITGNTSTYERMKFNLDFNAGEIIDKGLSIPEVGTGLLKTVIETASGVPTKAEIGLHDELFCITRSYGG